MMDKRNKFWRRQQMARVFKVRMIFYTSCGNCVIHDDGSVDNHPHWFDMGIFVCRYCYFIVFNY